MKLALCILSLRRSATSEATAASLFRSAGRSDAGNEHLRSLVQAVNRILMVDEVDLMEELQVYSMLCVQACVIHGLLRWRLYRRE